MSPQSRVYRFHDTTNTTADILSASLFVQDEVEFTKEMLLQHQQMIYEELLARITHVVQLTTPPTHKLKRELRFMVDELIETAERIHQE